MKNVTAVILGGGQGARLFPLTQNRAKPAVPIGGKFRLIDVPLSNCIHADIKRIFVLTQYNSESLHRHIHQTYQFGTFSNDFVQILAAQQTNSSKEWYQGTADAVRQNLSFITHYHSDYTLILSGDQLYHLDFKELIEHHKKNKADITISVLPVNREDAKGFGILRTNDVGRIVEFHEKPTSDRLLDDLKIPDAMFSQYGIKAKSRNYLASMGIYLFNTPVLEELLRTTNHEDFGKQVIPNAIGLKKVYSYFFDGYWEDIGTVKSFHQANLSLTDDIPKFDFYDEGHMIFTHPRYLPGSKLKNAAIKNAVICEGSLIQNAEITRSVIGVRSIIRSGSVVENTVMMGSDYYQTTEFKVASKSKGKPLMGIGHDSIIKNAIVDKNARIGNNVKLINKEQHTNYADDCVHIIDGIIVVPKNTIVPNGYEI